MPEQQKPQLPTRELIVTALKGPKTGTSSNGRDWSLWQVEATTPEGEKIALKLNTFEELPIGKTITVTVKKKESEQYGDSYTLALPKAKTGIRLNDLEQRMTAVERHVGMRQ